MAPQIKKAKTAFLFYQADQLSKIRKERGLAMGEAMTEVSLTSKCRKDPMDGATKDGIVAFDFLFTKRRHFISVALMCSSLIDWIY